MILQNVNPAINEPSTDPAHFLDLPFHSTHSLLYTPIPGRTFPSPLDSLRGNEKPKQESMRPSGAHRHPSSKLCASGSPFQPQQQGNGSFPSSMSRTSLPGVSTRGSRGLNGRVSSPLAQGCPESSHPSPNPATVASPHISESDIHLSEFFEMWMNRCIQDPPSTPATAGDGDGRDGFPSSSSTSAPVVAGAMSKNQTETPFQIGLPLGSLKEMVLSPLDLSFGPMEKGGSACST